MHRHVLTALALAVSTTAAAATIGVIPKKLIVVDKLTAAGKAKVVYVSKDQASGITKGTGTDPAQISVQFDVVYGSAAGSFTLPQGVSNGTDGWLVNKDAVAKYVNKDAPAGATQAKVAVVKPGKLLKLVGKGLGDTPLDVFAAGDPGSGGVQTAYCVTNGGEEFCHCSDFSGCAYKLIAKDTGAKLVCKSGVADAGCAALGASTTSTTTTSTTSTTATTATTIFAGPSFPPDGGTVTADVTGNAQGPGGADVSYHSFSPTTWTALYFGPWAGALPGAGLDGMLHSLPFAGISGAGDTVGTWQGTTSWTDPSDSTTYPNVPIRLTLTITAPLSGLEWEPSTGVPGLDPGPGSGIGAVIDIAPAGTVGDYTVKFEFMADIPTDAFGFIPLSGIPQQGGGQTQTSVSTGFYSQP
jgi:hypothetical protein